MRITHEADYAVRIIYILANKGGRMGAKEISELSGVTLRFSLKILRKLLQADLLESFKGVNGGYMLKKLPTEISLADVIEAIDGSIQINHCLSNEFECTRVRDKSCDFKATFGKINHILRTELAGVTFDQFI